VEAIIREIFQERSVKACHRCGWSIYKARRRAGIPLFTRTHDSITLKQAVRNEQLQVLQGIFCARERTAQELVHAARFARFHEGKPVAEVKKSNRSSASDETLQSGRDDATVISKEAHETLLLR